MFGNRVKPAFAIVFAMAFFVASVFMAGPAFAAENTAQAVPGVSQDRTDHRILFSEDRNGVYFLQTENSKYHLLFYDLSAKTLTEEMTCSTYQTKFFSDDRKLWFFTEKSERVTQNGGYLYRQSLEITEVDLATGGKRTYGTGVFQEGNSYYISSFDAAAVDRQGRIYVACTNHLFLMDSSGALISDTEYEGAINEFYGFDSTNGNFFYRGRYNWVYWGYDHYMAALMAGNVGQDGTVTMPEKNLMILYQESYRPHKQSAQFLDGRYLAVVSGFAGDNMAILDSHAYDVNDYTNQETVISMDGKVSVSVLNITNVDAVALQAKTAASEYPSGYLDYSSEGPRGALASAGREAIVKTDARVLTAYEMWSGKQMLQGETSYNVYDFATFGNTCVIVERDGDQFYVETLDWTTPTDFQAEVPQTMTVGQTERITCDTAGQLKADYEYASADPEVASVTAKGQISAWSAGETEVTISSPQLGLSKKVKVRVTDSALSGSSLRYEVTKAGSGEASENIHLPYTSGAYGSVTDSSLAMEGSDIVRVEYCNDHVLVETYDPDGWKLKNTKTIEPELRYFGGFYSGADANYLVFGQPNKDESDEVEVIRVVKYDKSWNRLGACSVKGANTYVPFDAGGLDMTEWNGELYIHTCHGMYDDGDGLHHQANCTFKIQESDMTLLDSYTGVMNLSEGYVSHSFQQKIAVDGQTVFRSDLGDAYPRAITLTKTAVGDKFADPYSYGRAVDIPGQSGRNYTGFVLGGLELSDDHYLIAGCGIAGVDQSTRNVFISAGAKDKINKEPIWITSHSEGGAVNCGTPKLAKLNDNQFLLLWEEYETDERTYDRTYVTKMCLVAPDGQQIGQIVTVPLSLSDCEPVVDRDGSLVWYCTNGEKPVFVRINPYRLMDIESAIKDDPAFQPKKGGKDPFGTPYNVAEDSSGDTGEKDPTYEGDPSDPSHEGDLDDPIHEGQPGGSVDEGDPDDPGSGLVTVPEDQLGADGTALGAGASAKAAENAILGMKNDADPAGTRFGLLQTRSTKQTKTSVTITWKKVPGAKKYVVYGNQCGKTKRMQRLTETGKNKLTFKKLTVNGKTIKVKKGTYYKFVVLAIDKNDRVVSTSKVVHVATKGGKVGNHKKVTTKAKKNKVTLKKGKSFKLKAKAVPASKKLKVKNHRAIAYESSDPATASVDKKGVIKAKKKGVCYVFAYAQNGVFQKIKVTVK